MLSSQWHNFKMPPTQNHREAAEMRKFWKMAATLQFSVARLQTLRDRLQTGKLRVNERACRQLTSLSNTISNLKRGLAIHMARSVHRLLGTPDADTPRILDFYADCTGYSGRRSDFCHRYGCRIGT